MTRAAPIAPTGRLEAVASAVRGEVRADERLAPHTTFGIGGPADLWVEPADADDLRGLLAACREAGVPWWVVGGGSNLLVSDAGVRGVVVHLPDDGPVAREDGEDGRVRLTLPAGMGTGKVRGLCRAEGLLGAELLAGIPGSLGGAVRMNAGTRLGEMVDVVEAAEVVDADAVRWRPAADFAFAYRHAEVPEGAVVTRVRLALRPADAEARAAAEAAARAELARRHATQPRGKSAGSIFKNPIGDHAGRLVEACGLKGRRIGGAVVSEVHANFIVNEGGATARDVLDLVEICRSEVDRRFGVHLELEVRLVGDFS